MFLKHPRKGEQVEIRGSILRYVSDPGQVPEDAGTTEALPREIFWRKRRIEVAKRSRIR